MEGPAFPTKAQSKLYRDGFAKSYRNDKSQRSKLGKRSLNRLPKSIYVIDYDCCNQNCESVSVEMIFENLLANANYAKSIISAAAKRILLSRPSSYFHTSFKDALATPTKQSPDVLKVKSTYLKINIVCK